jgi:hypothetical protein
MGNKVNLRNNTLCIAYRFSSGMTEKDYNSFLDWLGDNDIVTAYELGRDSVCFQGDVYDFSEEQMWTLINTGQTSLNRIDSLENCVHTSCSSSKDYISWYYN